MLGGRSVWFVPADRVDVLNATCSTMAEPVALGVVMAVPSSAETECLLLFLSVLVVAN